jgi:opacity protein-like surface antigen
MKSTLMKIIPVILAASLAGLLLPSNLSADEALKVRVVAARANVRQTASMTGTVILGADRGQVFDVLNKSGEWYQVQLPAGATGYLHTSVVEEFAEAAAPPVNEAAPKVAPPVRQPAAPVRREPAFAPAPSPSAGPDPTSKRFYVRVGGAYASQKASYENSWTFDMYYEEAGVSEAYAIDSSGITVDVGAGFFLTRNLGLEISFIPGSGKTAGTFTAQFPHPFYYGYYREMEWSNAELKYASPELNLNLIARFDLRPGLQAYLSAGGTYFLGVKIESLASVNPGETAYPYNELAAAPEYATYEKSGFGFNGAGGLDYFLTNNIGINANVRYTIGTIKIALDSGLEAAIKAGGLRASLGLKFVF